MKVSQFGGWDHRQTGRQLPDRRLPTFAEESEALLAWPSMQKAQRTLLQRHQAILGHSLEFDHSLRQGRGKAHASLFGSFALSEEVDSSRALGFFTRARLGPRGLAASCCGGDGGWPARS